MGPEKLILPSIPLLSLGFSASTTFIGSAVGIFSFIDGFSSTGAAIVVVDDDVVVVVILELSSALKTSLSIPVIFLVFSSRRFLLSLRLLLITLS